MSNKFLAIIAVFVGILFLAVSIIYFTHPANSLPNFFPGYDVAIAKTHFKHGIGSLFLALGAFVFAWFKSGKKSSKKEQ